MTLTPTHPALVLTYLQAPLQPLTYGTGIFSTLISLKMATSVSFRCSKKVCFQSGIKHEKAYFEKSTKIQFHMGILLLEDDKLNLAHTSQVRISH